jgi:CTP:molybdopterin cytidylyltransferase MocA
VGSTVSLVLAASPGEGFERSRWLARWGRTTLLGHVLDEVRSWGLEPGLVVLGADAERVLAGIDFAGFSVLIDPEWREGESASVRAGLDYLVRHPEIASVVLVDGDAAQMTGRVVEELLESHRRTDRPASVPKYRYHRGRPLIIDRDLWPRFLGLEEGAEVESVLDTHLDLVDEVWVDHLPSRKVITPMDLSEMAPRR